MHLTAMTDCWRVAIGKRLSRHRRDEANEPLSWSGLFNGSHPIEDELSGGKPSQAGAAKLQKNQAPLWRSIFFTLPITEQRHGGRAYCGGVIPV